MAQENTNVRKIRELGDENAVLKFNVDVLKHGIREAIEMMYAQRIRNQETYDRRINHILNPGP